jgi:hypothetical protein
VPLLLTAAAFLVIRICVVQVRCRHEYRSPTILITLLLELSLLPTIHPYLLQQDLRR